MTDPVVDGRVDHLDPADRVAAWVTSIGIGLLVFMITWLVGARVTERIWEQPSAAIIAMCVAVAAGVIFAAASGRRLRRRSTLQGLQRRSAP
ncbi:MAG TPA: hypothetical protein VLQ67_10140 [Arachnia sp.]|nr:hypothetical protein [Arachnia sp.]